MSRIGRRRLLLGAAAAMGATACDARLTETADEQRRRRFAGAPSLPIELGIVGSATVPEWRGHLVALPDDLSEDQIQGYPEGVRDGIRQGWLFALWRCTHLGCMAPRCETSAWFECPCHGGRFSHTGEWRAGPSERGLDYHPVAVFDDRVHVLTTEVVEGLPAGVEIIESQPRGPHCVGEGQS